MDINGDSMNMKGITAEDIKEAFEKRFPKDQLLEARIEYYSGGPTSGIKAPHLWIRMRRERFHDGVRLLSNFGLIHNSVASGSDLGEEIEVLYHLNLFSEKDNGQITVTMGVVIPKSDPRYESICDIVPGAMVTEREKQEFLGVVVENTPDPRKLFLAESGLGENVYPWRWDETGVEAAGLVTKIHEKYPAPGSEEERAMRKKAAQEKTEEPEGAAGTKGGE